MLDFRLKVFQCVAHNLSFTKASNELFVTQPAISKHIKELEAEFGLRLFDRIGNKIALTPSGKTLLHYADRIAALHNEAKFEMGQLANKTVGTLRIGASTSVAQYVLPPALARFNERYPGIKLLLYSGNTENIETRLLINEIDVGIVEGKPGNASISYTPFLDDELLVFVDGKNKSVAPVVSNNDFLQLPLVLRERGSGTLEIIENSLYDNKINPGQLNVLIYLGSTEAIKLFIKSGNGVGIVSGFAIKQELNDKTFRQIKTPGLKFNRRFYFISPKGPEPTGMVKLFLDFLRKHYTEAISR